MKIFFRSLLLPAVITLTLFSCQTEILPVENIPTPPSPTPNPPITAVDSMTVLKTFISASLSTSQKISFFYGIDSLPTKCVEMNKKDTTYFHYTSNKKLSRTLTRFITSTFDSAKRPIIFVYTGNLLSKVIAKRNAYSPGANFYLAAYETDITTNSNIDSYDSLIYDNSNKLIGKYSFIGPPGSPLFSYDTITYQSNNDSLIYSVTHYRYSFITNSYYIFDKTYFNEYYLNKKNPLYYTCKELSYIIGGLQTVPVFQTNSYNPDIFQSLNPYLVKTLLTVVNSTTQNSLSFSFTNQYDSAGRTTSQYNNSISYGGYIRYEYYNKPR